VADRPAFHADERVDLLDFLRVVSHAPLDAARAAAALLAPMPWAPNYGLVFGGFAIAPKAGAGAGVTVTLGNTARALLTELRDGDLHPGLTYTDENGAATVTLDSADFTPAAGSNHWDLYLRVLHDPTSAENRVFWNSATPGEQLQLVNTVSRVTLQLATVVHAAAAPWTNGVLIAELDNTLGAPGVFAAGEISGLRKYVFEGAEGDAWEPDGALMNWGDGGTDRNADRGLYGVHDLTTFALYVRRQFKDILGATSYHPWSAVTLQVPSLENLAAEHWPEATTATFLGHHKSLQVTEFASDPVVAFHRTTNADVRVAQHLTGLDFRRPAAGSPLVRFWLHAGGASSGVTISGPDGLLGVNMAAGESAQLRFGDPNPGGGWDNGDDFGIVAHGAAAHVDRRLSFATGAPYTERFWIDGNGDAGPSRDLVIPVARNVVYDAVRTFRRNLSASTFLAIDEDTGAAGTTALIKDVDASVLAVAARWAFVHRTVTGPTQAPGGAWAQTLGISGSFAASVASVDRIVSPGTWLPGAAYVQVGGHVDMVCAADAAFLAVANQRIEVGLYAIDKTSSPVTAGCVAYARVRPTLTLVAWSNTWIAGPAWATHGAGVIDHTLFDYFFVVQVYNGGAFGATAGACELLSVGVELAHTSLRN